MRCVWVVLGLCYAVPVVVAQEVLWRAEGIADQIRRGIRLETIGDVDGDGYEDLVEWVGVRIAQVPWCCFETQIWITSGRDGAMLSALHPRDNDSSWSSQSLAPLGDMNLDGVPDYGVTVTDTSGAARPPEFQVRSGWDHALIWSRTGLSRDRYGLVACGKVDVDGDGRNDVVVSATSASRGGTLIAYNHYGVEIYRVVDPRPDLLVGVDLAPLGGDLDGDGRGDFLTACPDDTERGAIAVVSGRNGSLLRVSYGDQPFDKLSYATGCGDLDGDGVVDYAGGGFWGNPVVTTFSGATGLRIHTYRIANQGLLGTFVTSGHDFDQDGVNDLLSGAPDLYVHALSGRNGGLLWTYNGWPWCTGYGVAVLAPPPGEQYPVLVFSSHCWQSPTNMGSLQYPGLIWAVRGHPPTVRSFGQPSASAGGTLARIGMYQQGSTLQVTLSNAPPSVPAALLLGWSDQSLAGQMLPWNLAGVGLPGITILTSSEVASVAVTGTGWMQDGYARLLLRAPLGAAGTPLFAQWVWLDAVTFEHGATAGHRLLLLCQ